MSKKVLVLIAEGFEDVEAVTPIDYLRRAGAEVVAAGLGPGEMRSARGLVLRPDASLGDLADSGALDASAWDAVVLPGGMPGAANLAASPAVADFVRAMAASGKLVGAVCAAPAVALAAFGVLGGKRFTCFPGMEDRVSGAVWSADRVVADGNLITSRSAGTAGEWAVEMAAYLFGREAADKVAAAVLLKS